MYKAFTISLLSVVIIFTACKEEIITSDIDTIRNEGTLVEVAEVTTHLAPIPIHAIGRLSSDRELRLSFKIGGIISNLSVDEGDYVRSGKVIGALRTNEIDAQVLKANTALDKAKRDLARVTAMQADGAATLEAVQDLTTLVQINQADLDIALFNQKYAQISSPVSGRILKRLAEPNELVSPGQPVYMLSTSSNGGYIMSAALSDRDINRVTRGDNATVWFDAYDQTKFEAQIIDISESADPKSGTYTVDLSVDHQGLRLRNGMIGRIEITPYSDKEYIKIPIDAIVESNDGLLSIFTPSQGDTIAREHQVSPALITHDHILVDRSALQSDRVITAGAPYLLDGDLIKIKS